MKLVRVCAVLWFAGAVVIADQASVWAAGKNLLAGLQFDLSFFSNDDDDDIPAHMDRDERFARAQGQDCVYRNHWQSTRHGKRQVKRVQVCNDPAQSPR